VQEVSDSNVVALYETNYRDVPATLRVIADEIEAGKYGEVSCLAVALLGDTMEVFGLGPDSDGTASASLLQAGALRIIGTIERHGR
jgi:hypothetical protein